jgi:glycosyltransferase involved in cell wall biosynthesis
VKILIVHNYYRQPGGEDESTKTEKRLLEADGHEVVEFTCHNDAMRAGLGSAARSLWNRESYGALRRLILREQPHVAHFHNTFYVVSPSAYWAAAAEGLPVVHTLHNYRLLCCNGLLFRDGRPCEECVGRRIPWPGVAHACYRESASASLAVSAVTTLHRSIGTWRDRIDVYVALSEFSRSKFISAGFPPAKVVVKPNCVHPDPGVGSGDGGFALFAGRLTTEKGVGTLLDAWELLGAEIPLRIVGDGPLAERVAAAARRPGVEWIGWSSIADVYELMGRARCVVVPSEWYEPFARVVVEALAKGTPAVVSDAGAPAGLVSDGVTGFHFRTGDPVDLARAIRRAFAADLDVVAMRRRARQEYESKYTGAVNCEMLLAIYAQATALRKTAALGAKTPTARPPDPAVG